MALPAPNMRRYTPEEYLALERVAEFKSEYFDGRIYPMNRDRSCTTAGSPRNHSRLKVDLARIIGNHILTGPCEVFDNDLRVRVDRDRCESPDLTVVCDRGQIEDAPDDTLLNPTAIFEVLSPSTEADDRGEKWGRYRRMMSLQQYVLVSQDEPLIEVFTRNSDRWTFSDAEGIDASIHLESINCTLALSDVYRRIVFEPPAAEEEAMIL